MLVPTALATALVVALVAGIVGPRIPGARAEPLYDTRGRGNGVTEVISPLVDIRSRLTNRSEVELFRVTSEAPAYWRVTALPEFDGRRFRLPESPLTDLDDVEAVGDRIVQQVQVLALRGQLVPAAATPIQAEGERDGETFSLQGDPSSSSLLAPSEFESGDVFTVVSIVPSFTREQLQGATSVAPPDEIFLDLPDDLPSVVAERAAEVTDGIDGSYERVRALQDWFRSEFEYSLEVQSGHGTSAIENFLQQQVGYCEQFSATFAAMARTLGIPTRVAVGFTQGVQGSDGWYQVLGKNAHAWPEVWFDGIGWVPFEPTPGRGAPGAQSYTDVEPQQDVTPSGATVDPNVTNPPTPTTIVPPPTTVPGADAGPTTTVGNDAVPNLNGNEAGGAPGAAADEEIAADDGLTMPWTTIIVLGVLAIALLAPWAVRRWRLRAARRYGPAQRVQAAWRHALDAVVDAGVTGRASMTAHEWATATATRLPVAARPMSSLAEVVDQISFAPPGRIDLERQGALGDTLGRDCELWSEQVSHIAHDTLSNPQRIKRYFTDWR
jgi:transglutaminase-like putative cysteine protease